jgi:hypothetical protein
MDRLLKDNMWKFGAILIILFLLMVFVILPLADIEKKRLSELNNYEETFNEVREHCKQRCNSFGLPYYTFDEYYYEKNKDMICVCSCNSENTELIEIGNYDIHACKYKIL